MTQAIIDNLLPPKDVSPDLWRRELAACLSHGSCWLNDLTNYEDLGSFASSVVGDSVRDLCERMAAIRQAARDADVEARRGKTKCAAEAVYAARIASDRLIELCLSEPT